MHLTRRLFGLRALAAAAAVPLAVKADRQIARALPAEAPQAAGLDLVPGSRRRTVRIFSPENRAHWIDVEVIE